MWTGCEKQEKHKKEEVRVVAYVSVGYWDAGV